MTKQELKWLGTGAGLGVVLISLLAAVPSQTDFDSTYFRTNALPITLVGTLTNWAKLSTNAVIWESFGPSIGPISVPNLLVGTNGTMWLGNGAFEDWVNDEGFGSNTNDVAFVSRSNVAKGGTGNQWIDIGCTVNGNIYNSGSDFYVNTTTNSFDFVLSADAFDTDLGFGRGPTFEITGVAFPSTTAFIRFADSHNQNVFMVDPYQNLSSGALMMLGRVTSNDDLIRAYNGTNGTNLRFIVDKDGLTSANTGFSSLATDAFLTFTATGRTNTLGKVGVARFDGTTLTYVVKNNANTPVYTNTVSVGHATEIVQAGGAIVITAGSASGTMSPF